MGKIQVLSDLLANKIAAGEVVERPASVIKELLENAVDAGSTEIIIEVEQGGLDLIKIADNGVGMEQDDALLAFERHATSKIKTDKDLNRIRTLGFRGEALPSIASVSKVEVRTRTAEANEGTLVKIEGGKLITHGVTAAKKGTEIAIRDLFFNTPARLKYLKSIQTELGHMIDYVNRLSLAHPHISFRMYHNGRQVLQTPGDNQLLHTIAAIYGHDIARQMMPVSWEDHDYKITGAVAFPEVNRANRNHCSFFINGRYIKSYQLLNAVLAAYHTRLPINRYPLVVISLELDPGLVDVNVHPNKLEARFSEEKDVIHAVQSAVESVLKKQTFIPKAVAKSFSDKPQHRTEQKTLDLQVPSSLKPAPPAPARGEATPYTRSYVPPTQTGTPAYSTTPASSKTTPYTQGGNGPRYREELPQGGKVIRETPYAERYQAKTNDPTRQQIEAAMGAYRSELKPEQPAQPRPDQPFVKGESGQPPAVESVREEVESVTEPLESSTPEQYDGVTTKDEDEVAPKPNVAQFRPIAQALGMYVIAQDDTGLYIIDQHAAHEKVLYEKFTKKLQERQIQPLPLLVPLTLELTAAEAVQLSQRIELLAGCQIEVESFGGTTFLIRTVPDIWEGLETQALLQELIDELLQEGAAPNPLSLIEAKVISKACKSAIKANQWMSMPEMVALCDQLRELDNPFTCPHGRPIIIHMSNYDLEKQFKRVM